MERFRTKRMERINCELIREAMEKAGITEECKSWSDWYADGYRVKPEEMERPQFELEIYPRYPVKGQKFKLKHYSRSQVARHPQMKIVI